MLRQSAGTIVNVASIAAKRALPARPSTRRTKAGLFGFSRVLAEELRNNRRARRRAHAARSTRRSGHVRGSPPRDKCAARGRRAGGRADAALPPHASLEELTLLPPCIL